MAKGEPNTGTARCHVVSNSTKPEDPDQYVVLTLARYGHKELQVVMRRGEFNRMLAMGGPTIEATYTELP